MVIHTAPPDFNGYLVMAKYPRKLGKWALISVKYLGIMVGSIALAVVLAEFVYRHQWIEFYKPELRAYNQEADLRGTGAQKSTILIIGDSFGAGARDVYPAMLREALPDFRVINSSMPGTGTIEAKYVAPKRFERFKPEILIYQMYVGNELFDIRQPSNLAQTSFIRWLYWHISNHVRVVEWIGYRLAQSGLGGLVHTLRVATAPQDTHLRRASEETYGPRERAIYAADPTLLDSTLYLLPDRRTDFRTAMENLREVLALCEPSSCRAFVLVVPHKVQVSAKWRAHYEAMGATFSDPVALLQEDYPFYRELRRSLEGAGDVTFVNPLPQLRAGERSGTKLFLPNDEHMTPEGQRLMADMLLEAVLDSPLTTFEARGLRG